MVAFNRNPWPQSPESAPCRLALNRAGQAYAKCLHREQPAPDELLNETLFMSLAQARVVLERWQVDYNGSRPHSQLGWKTPSEFALNFHPRRDLTLRYPGKFQLGLA
jgi:transposase InsO family protein